MNIVVGRLYIAADYGYNSYFYGRVCQGTGPSMISGINAENFGAAACEEMGFGYYSLKFIGTEAEYIRRYGKHDRQKRTCYPDYFITGAVCDDSAKKLSQVFGKKIVNS